jgi:hypothetical protein
LFASGLFVWVAVKKCFMEKSILGRAKAYEGDDAVRVGYFYIALAIVTWLFGGTLIWMWNNGLVRY